MLKKLFEKELTLSWLVILAVLTSVLTFPVYAPVFSNGIDPPLSWVFNYLINGNIALGKDIIFPHGPLAFLMYPLSIGNNYPIALLVHFSLRFLLAYSILRINDDSSAAKVTLKALASVLLLASLDILLVITGIVISGSYQYLKSRKVAWLLAALILTSFALFIKAFVGIVCVSIVVMLFLQVLFECIRNRREWSVVWFLPVLPLFVIAIWLTLYGTLSGLGRYFYGMFQLAGDNSAAVAYYPENDWILLGIAFASIFTLFVLHFRSKNVLRLMILLAPALFAVWKYGMAREDYLHSGMLFLFVFTIAVFIILTIEKLKKLSFLVALTIVFLFYLNLKNSFYYEPPSLSFNGVSNLYNLATDYNSIIDTCEKGSERNIRRNRLEEQVRNEIGEASVDVYPWDYSFIPANRLNWKPRPVLQSYACYTPWLDMENAKHFNSQNAPEFLIWELRKITHDIHNGTFEGIDGRYLFNDQPEAVLSILANYKIAGRQGGTFPVLVFRKRDNSLNLARKSLGEVHTLWNQWIDVPITAAGLLRFKVALERNTLGSVKSFLYKDESCYIYYYLSNGQIRMFRIVPKNAAQGLWVNPLPMNGETAFEEPEVIKIMLRCSNPGLMKSELTGVWENIILTDKNSNSQQQTLSVNSLLGKDFALMQTELFRSVNRMEGDNPAWSPIPDKGSEIKVFSGNYCSKLAPGGYSSSLTISIDSLKMNSSGKGIIIRGAAWINAESRPDAALVISIEKEGKSVSYKGAELQGFLVEPGSWNFSTNFLVAEPDFLAQPGLSIKFYIWNKGKESLYVDDLDLVVESL
ncbi:MAG: hypothetical protein IPH88_13100 [Bacteroidales bacterium]|nr:hypothetical protein [Bacteroidales bacterium]